MQKGFTLIELLIVIAILAILSTAVVITLNPAQILAQNRDVRRMSDLDNIKSAINLYLTTVDDSQILTTTTCTVIGCANPFSALSIVVTTSTAVNGTGWVRVNLASTTGGSTLSVLPLDPVNSGNYFYAYAGDSNSKTFELNARLESLKYRDTMVNDGGNKNTCSTYTENTCFYEVGTDPGLDL
jgi:prepilin-type N-terminal cleavage/methylation domain-containing protein